MAKKETWPKTMGDRVEPYVCCVCHKPIKKGQTYHYIRRKGTRYIHDACYWKEVRG